MDTDFYGSNLTTMLRLGTTNDGFPFSMLEGLIQGAKWSFPHPDLDMVVVRTGYDKHKAKKRNLPVDTYTVIDVARRLQ